MRHIKHFLPIVLIGASLCMFMGCSTDEQANSPVATPGTGAPVPFQLPAGWETKNEDGAIAGRTFVANPESKVNEILLQFYIAGTGDADQPEKLREAYVTQQKNAYPEADVTLSTISIGDVDIYIAEQQTDAYYGFDWWNTGIYFQKDGRTYVIYLNDLAKNHEEALKMLVQTLNSNLTAQIYESRKQQGTR